MIPPHQVGYNLLHGNGAEPSLQPFPEFHLAVAQTMNLHHYFVVLYKVSKNYYKGITKKQNYTFCEERKVVDSDILSNYPFQYPMSRSITSFAYF